jgi:glycosyltransferase involved in cell wall biosynthesis
VTRAAFVVPHRAEHSSRTELLQRTLRAIEQQSDENWICVISDDASPIYESNEELMGLIPSAREKVYVTRSTLKSGPGACRNRAIRVARALGADIILHQDDDDLPHPHRVEFTRQVFRVAQGNPFMYSPFVQIDDNDRELEASKLRLDMLEVTEQLERGALVGEDVFVDMVCRTGFIAALSSVALTTASALRHPFPSFGRASDDSHTWMRLAASGANFVYEPRLRFGYRVPSNTPVIEGGRVRPPDFLEEKVYNDIDGFECGVHILLDRGIPGLDIPGITARFLGRLAETIERQHFRELARRVRSESVRRDVISRLTGDKCQ